MKKLWGVAAVGILAVVGLNLFYVCRLNQLDYEKKIDELTALRQSIFESEYINSQLKARVAHLKTDRGVEEVAREKLGFVYADETAYVVVPTQPPHKPEVMTFPVNTSVNEEHTLFYSFLHVAFAPAEVPAPAARGGAKKVGRS